MYFDDADDEHAEQNRVNQYILSELARLKSDNRRLNDELLRLRGQNLQLVSTVEPLFDSPDAARYVFDLRSSALLNCTERFCALLKWPNPAALLGKPLDLFVAPEYLQRTIRFLRQTHDHGKVVKFDQMYLTKDGEHLATIDFHVFTRDPETGALLSDSVTIFQTSDASKHDTWRPSASELMSSSSGSSSSSSSSSSGNGNGRDREFEKAHHLKRQQLRESLEQLRLARNDSSSEKQEGHSDSNGNGNGHSNGHSNGNGSSSSSLTRLGSHHSPLSAGSGAHGGVNSEGNGKGSGSGNGNGSSSSSEIWRSSDTRRSDTRLELSTVKKLIFHLSQLVGLPVHSDLMDGLQTELWEPFQWFAMLRDDLRMSEEECRSMWEKLPKASRIPFELLSKMEGQERALVHGSELGSLSRMTLQVLQSVDQDMSNLRLKHLRSQERFHALELCRTTLLGILERLSHDMAFGLGSGQNSGGGSSSGGGGGGSGSGSGWSGGGGVTASAGGNNSNVTPNNVTPGNSNNNNNNNNNNVTTTTTTTTTTLSNSNNTTPNSNNSTPGSGMFVGGTHHHHHHHHAGSNFHGDVERAEDAAATILTITAMAPPPKKIKTEQEQENHD